MTLATMQIEEVTASVPVLGSVGVVIPTYNAERHWRSLRQAIDRQGLDPCQILVIDSSSTDRTRALALESGYRLIRIDQRDFSHGGTRQFAISHLSGFETILYLTQDAIPAEDDSFRNLCAVFADPAVGAAYGRQIPRRQAGAIERHARFFNYPERSSVRTFDSRLEIGIKAAFLSNSFAAYRRSALEQVGGFPSTVIMAEDSFVAARMLLAGWKVAYVAEAPVLHSHPLTLRQEFSRYFDTGVHHSREPWILNAFGDAGAEGKRFLRSELKYLLTRKPGLLPEAILRTLGKFAAYQLGLHEKHLPLSIKTGISSQPEFWLRMLAGSGRPSYPPLELPSIPDSAEGRTARL